MQLFHPANLALVVVMARVVVCLADVLTFASGSYQVEVPFQWQCVVALVCVSPILCTKVALPSPSGPPAAWHPQVHHQLQKLFEHPSPPAATRFPPSSVSQQHASTIKVLSQDSRG